MKKFLSKAASIALSLPAFFLLQQNAKADELTCIAPQYQIFDKPTCFWPKDIVSRCSSLAKDSIYYQCNVFDLSIGRDQTRVDDLGNQYHSAIFKYSERNSCSTGDNDALSILGKCDTFAAYVQVFRNVDTGKCYALVNAALLGTQLQEDSLRNSPRKVIQKVEIPGVARRITFTPSSDSVISSQPSAALVATSDKNRNPILSGPALGTLSLLELENTLTIKPENLKPNPAKIRITRGVGSSSDFLDVPLGKGNEEALNRIISQCS
jgi:hypothetical protein